jgi:small-conductance mechanosensitive channel
MFEPLQDAISTFLSYVPQLIGAILILIIGYIVARLLQALVTRILQGIGFENWMERGGVKRFFDRARTDQTPSSILGLLVFWFVFIIAITMAADALGLRQISGFLNQLIAFIPSIFVAILILFLATLLANFVSRIVRGATGSDILASITQYAIIVYAVFAAITQLGIAVELTAPTFLILLGAIALALAIAFGLGGREVARDIVEKTYNRHQQLVDRSTEQHGATGGTQSERPEAHRLRREE